MSTLQRVIQILAGQVLALACIASGETTDRASEGVELRLVQNGAEIELADDDRIQLATRVVSYFETCRTLAAVVGEEPPAEGLARKWAEQERETHVVVLLPVGEYGRHSIASPSRLMVGFVGSGAGPVLTRSANDEVAMYAKCEGLESLLLACELHETVPSIDAPNDCARLRESKERLLADQSAG